MPVLCSPLVLLTEQGPDQLSIELPLSVTGPSDRCIDCPTEGCWRSLTSVNDHPGGYWHFGRGNLFLWNLAVQEKQRAGLWLLHSNNASATIIMTTKITSPTFPNTGGRWERRRGSYYFQPPMLRTGRTQGSRHGEHNANHMTSEVYSDISWL